MATVTRPQAQPVRQARPVDAAPQGVRTPAVMWWATLGALVLAFEVYLAVRWVTGPYFRHVSTGPDSPPTWMKAGMVAGMAGSILVTGVLLWRAVIRPRRRDGRFSTDGLIVISAFLFVWQDPMSSYLGNAFTYNAWFPNMGSWVHGVPGWLASGTPGHTVPEPILLTPFVYAWLFPGAAVLGCWFMRRLKTRWPGLGDIRLVLLCLLFMIVGDIVVEGMFMMPLGWFEYPGGHLSIFPDAYNKYPLTEGFFAGAWVWGMACFRYFRNDRGETIAERGIDGVKVGRHRRDALRFLAIFGALNVIVLVTYNLPTAIVAGAHSSAWPQALQNRSYLMDGVCGPRTDRACPGPNAPLARGNGSAYEGFGGRLVIPPGTRAATMPGGGLGRSGPYHGPLF